VAENSTFCTAEGFPFPLLCDKDKHVGKAYGVADGDYASRATFVIKDGEIKQVWPKVSPQGHAQEVLDFVKTL